MLVRRHSGAVRTLPTTVTGVSNMLSLLAIGSGHQAGRAGFRSGRTVPDADAGRQAPDPDLWTARVHVDNRTIFQVICYGRGTVQTWRPTSSAADTCAALLIWAATTRARWSRRWSAGPRRARPVAPSSTCTATPTISSRRTWPTTTSSA